MEKNYSEKLNKIMNGAKFRRNSPHKFIADQVYSVMFEPVGYVVCKRAGLQHWVHEAFIDSLTDRNTLAIQTGGMGKSALITFDVENDFVLID